MINKLANKIVRHYISKNKIEKEHEEVYNIVKGTILQGL